MTRSAQTPPNLPFEGNVIRAIDFAPCPCTDAPHWVVTEQADGTLASKACPGRFAVEPYPGGDASEILGYRLLKPR